MNDEASLDETFQRYREACPEVEPSVNFMPALWQKIESRQSFWSLFARFGGVLTTVSAALCLLLLALNLVSSRVALTPVPSYADALMADHSAEKTYYAEAIRNPSPTEDVGTPTDR